MFLKFINFFLLKCLLYNDGNYIDIDRHAYRFSLLNDTNKIHCYIDCLVAIDLARLLKKE